MSSSTALTLTSQAAPSRSRTHAPAYWHSTLVSSTDSLPYYDREWDQGSDTLQAQVEQEIDAELQRMGKQGRKAAEKRLGKEFQFSQVSFLQQRCKLADDGNKLTDRILCV